MLGHDIQFSYCRTVGNSVPCRKILDCWFERFDVESYVTDNFGVEMIKKLAEPPKPKLSTILELIEQAKKNSANQSTD